MMLTPAGLLILLEFSLMISCSSYYFSNICSLLYFCEIFIETLETIDFTKCLDLGLLVDSGLLTSALKLMSPYSDFGDLSSFIILISGES